jgi:hypothetical protein
MVRRKLGLKGDAENRVTHGFHRRRNPAARRVRLRHDEDLQVPLSRLACVNFSGRLGIKTGGFSLSVKSRKSEIQVD